MLGSGTQQTFASAQNSGSRWNAAGSSDSSAHAKPVSATAQSSQAGFQFAAYHPASAALVAEPQHGGGGGGAGGGHGGGGGLGGGAGGGAGGGTGGGTGGGAGGGKGGTGGGTGGTGGGKGGTGGGTGTGRPTVGNPYANTPYNQARQIVPQFPTSASTNQQVMYALATGTGGFPILNTNDLMSGLEKIAREQSQYYLLGYTPAESASGKLPRSESESGSQRHQRSRAQRILQHCIPPICWPANRSKKKWNRARRLPEHLLQLESAVQRPPVERPAQARWKRRFSTPRRTRRACIWRWKFPPLQLIPQGERKISRGRERAGHRLPSGRDRRVALQR